MKSNTFNVIRHEAHTGVTGTATAALKIGDAVKVSGVKSFAPAGAGDIVVGVSHHAAAVGEVATIRIRGDIIPMTALGAIAAGAQVKPGATAGTVSASADGVGAFGVAWDAASGTEVNVIVL